MRKCLPLNLLQPTRKKKRSLHETYETYLSVVKEVLGYLDGVKTRGQLHAKTYETLRGKHSAASQLIIEATSHAWSIRNRRRQRKGQRGSDGGGIERCVVRFDMRLFSFKATRRGNPVLTLRTSAERIALPLARDGSHRRLQEHLLQGWELTSIIMKRSLRLLAVLAKETPNPKFRINWLGVDVNSPRIGASAVGPGRGVIKQSYYGQDIASKQFSFEKKRALLQRHRDAASRGKAGLKLKRLSRKQRNYVRSEIWVIANQIVRQAEALGANIAIERLRHLRKHRGEWTAGSRRKVNRLPYGFIRHALSHVAEGRRVLLIEVDPRYTSQTCPRCGYTTKVNLKGYTTFKCQACGYEANRDRVASLNIALRAAQQQTTRLSRVDQFPVGNASVSRRIWQGEGLQQTASNSPELQAHKL
jgi:putative transposase